MLIALIGCGSAKLATPAPAIDLYIGSLFVAHRCYAERRNAAIWILSAKHGLLDASQLIAPYNETLAGAPAVKREQWNQRIVRQLSRTFMPGTRAILLAGSAYHGWLRAAHGLVVEDPIGRLPIGRRLQKLKQMTEAIHVA